MTYAEQRSARYGMTPCPTCPRVSGCPPIPPDIPGGAGVLFLGEGPGKEENSKGRCFVGGASDELNKHYLPLAGLERGGVGMDNCLKCYLPVYNAKRDRQLLQQCAAYHLPGLLNKMKPKLIVPMGPAALSLAGDYDLEAVHGRYLGEQNWCGVWVPTFAMIHFALGLHQTSAIQTSRDDFKRLRAFLDFGDDQPVDEFPDPMYMELETASDVASAVYGTDDDPCATDTETVPVETQRGVTRQDFWCLSFSTLTGTGYMIRKANERALEEYKKWARRRRGLWLVHNYLFDGPVYEQIGLFLRRFDDTMVRAYHLGNQPQSLKVLAWRLCGMKMEEFEDLVRPFARQKAIGYFETLAQWEWPKPEEYLVLNDDGSYRLYRPQSLTQKLRRGLGDATKDPETDLLDRWRNWSDEEKLPAISMFGPMPVPSIELAWERDKRRVTHYSCRDSDATLRVWWMLRRLAVRFRQMRPGKFVLA